MYILLGKTAELPTKFDTPMFWNASELEELKGTSVVGLLSIPVMVFRTCS
jgi:hypothetical protein